MNGLVHVGRLVVVLLLAPLGLTSVLGARPAAPAFPDDYGYVVFDSPGPDCAFDFVDIESSGVALSLVASGAEPAQDDGAAIVALDAPFELYGESGNALVVSSNGYIALAPTLADEDGGDFSNDAILPAIPDNLNGTGARILAYHDELSGVHSAGLVYRQYFATCPRVSEALGLEDCTVLQWADWALFGSSVPFDLQAILYHQSSQIVVQIRPGAAVLNGGTIGIQNRAVDDASQYRPDGALAGNTAICFLDPRYPAGGPVADLEVSNADTVEVASPGQLLTYEIGVLNRGPSPANGVEVDNPIPPTLVNCSWSCLASDGSTCSASGTGGIADTVNLEPLGWADYLLFCEPAAVTPSITNTVSAAIPPGISDPQPVNNSATDVDLIGAGALPASLLVERSGAQLDLSWEASCLASDDDYAVYEGMLGDFTGHLPIACSTAGALGLTHTLPAGSAYYLVVPANDFVEGSYGLATSGERPASTTACGAQAVGACP